MGISNYLLEYNISETEMSYLCLAHMSESDMANMANSVKDIRSESGMTTKEPLDRKMVCLSVGTADVHLASIAWCQGKGGDIV